MEQVASFQLDRGGRRHRAQKSSLETLAIQTLPKVGRPSVGVGRSDGSGNEAKSDNQDESQRPHGSSPAVQQGDEPTKCRSRIARRDQRSPPVGCSSQNFLASSAFADPATPARTDRATRTPTIVFMVGPPVGAMSPTPCRRASCGRRMLQVLLFERYLLVSRFPLETSPNLGMSQLRRTRGIARKRASSDGPLPPLSTTHP